jgi:amino acid transporter
MSEFMSILGFAGTAGALVLSAFATSVAIAILVALAIAPLVLDDEEEE